MKLLRIASDKGDGSFEANFNEHIVLPPHSKMALQSCSFKIATDDLEVDASNDEITYQLSNNNQRQVHLNHAMYDALNTDQLLSDMESTLNSGLALSGKDLGSQFKVDKDQDKCRIQVKSARLREDNAYAEYNNVVRTGGNGQGIYGSQAATSTTNYIDWAAIGKPLGQGSAIFRARIREFVVEPNRGVAFQGVTLALMAKHPSQYTSITEADITYGIRFFTAGANYNGFQEGQHVPGTFGALKVDGAANRTNNDVMALSIFQGKIEGHVYQNNRQANNPRVVFTGPFDASAYPTLYPVMFFHSKAFVSASDPCCRLELVRATLDPYRINATESLPIETDIVNATPLPTQHNGNPTHHFLELPPSVAEYLGFVANRHPIAGTVVTDSFSHTAGLALKGEVKSDMFLIQMMNVPLESYDSLTTQRESYLALVPQSNNNNNQSVLYAPPYPSFIDIKNEKPIYLRNIKARILQADRARIDTEGLCSLVLLVESGASQFHP